MKHLVIGASGFLGSHVARVLVEQGEDTRVLVRQTSSLRGIDDLELDVRHGDIFDAESVREAMAGVDIVYYCVVDARAWMPANVLRRTNVDGLRKVLDVAAEAELSRFVFTSTMGTLPVGENIDEDSGPHNWLDAGGDYIRSRVDAEKLVLSYTRDRGLPAVAMCVANTYGPGDYLPTPHGGLLAASARGKLPVYVRGAGAEVVDVRDAALALVLAGQRGRVGERYIVASRYMSTRELHDLAADSVGAPRARWGVPTQALAVVGFFGDQLSRFTRRESRLTRATVRLMHIWTPLDHSKATRELGWEPRPPEEFIPEAAAFFTRPRSSR